MNGHLEVVKALVATRANPNVYNDFRKRCSCAADGVKLKILEISVDTKITPIVDHAQGLYSKYLAAVATQ